jgi:redox-sensitive bicupin YhaK (pirin superfamily)
MLRHTLEAKEIDLGGLVVGRVLPVAQQRSLGPFVFLDHMGPHQMKPGGGFDVRPHPHIGLATLTYLYEGDSVHRDSMGIVQAVLPGDVNVMSAGHGVVHSERSSVRMRTEGGPMNGLQYWLALPAANEDDAPSFQHAGKEELPRIEGRGSILRVVLGRYREHASPIAFPSQALLYDIELEAGAELTLLSDDAFPGHETELGVYVSSGALEIDGTLHAQRHLGVLVNHGPSSEGRTTLRATALCRVAVFGGAPLDGPRKMFWNFVATTDERIERAKQRWLDRGFPAIPGDDEEFIPLPGSAPHG